MIGLGAVPPSALVRDRVVTSSLMRASLIGIFALSITACTAHVSDPPPIDAGTADVGPSDRGVAGDADVGADLGAVDAEPDGGAAVDATQPDAAEPDAGPRDYGPARDAGDLSQYTATERSLIELPADTWLRIPTGFRSVCDDNGEWRAVSGCDGITAFSGGLYDPEHRWMLVFGGGHNDYAGNEVYAFKLGDFTWERLTTPSLGPYNQDPLNDGQPVSRHTYDGLTWIGDQRLMWTWGGSRANDGNGTNLVWTFDPITTVWSNVTPLDVPGSAYETSAIWDPITDKVYLKAGEHFRTYDPNTGTFAEPHNFGSPPLWPRYAGGRQRVALDDLRRILWFVGGGLYMLYDLDADTFVTDEWITTGGGDFSNATQLPEHPAQHIQTGGAALITSADPGLDYDRRADQLIGWNGTQLWALDLSAKVWTSRSVVGGPTGTGTHEVYGRFRYIDALNVFILIESPDEVWFYKNTPGP